MASVPLPNSIATLTFVDPTHGWAIDTCSPLDTLQICDILATSDGGKTWHVQHRGTEQPGSLQFLDAQNGFAIEGAGSILVTNDGGTTWTQRYATAPRDLAGIRFVTPQIAFATASGVIFQLNLPSVLGLSAEDRLAVDIKNAWVFNYGNPDCSFVSTSSSPTGDVWAGGSGPAAWGGPCLYRTKNLGKTWTASFAKPASPSVAGALSKSGFFPTPSSATPQISQKCSSDAPRFFTPSQARLFIACEMGSGITLTSTDGGRTWSFASVQNSCLMGCMTMNYQTGSGGPTFYLDNEHAWQRTAHQEISWSTDGGQTWNSVQSDALCCDANNIFFVDANHGWITFGESIAVTSDGGRTWRRLPVTIQ